jgi:hypothetical protein
VERGNAGRNISPARSPLFRHRSRYDRPVFCCRKLQFFFGTSQAVLENRGLRHNSLSRASSLGAKLCDGDLKENMGISRGFRVLIWTAVATETRQAVLQSRTSCHSITELTREIYPSASSKQIVLPSVINDARLSPVPGSVDRRRFSRIFPRVYLLFLTADHADALRDAAAVAVAAARKALRFIWHSGNAGLEFSYRSRNRLVCDTA